MTAPGLFDRRVLIVSGKGGAGKTSVAAACAMAASRSGRTVLLVEVEGREGVAGLLGIEAPGFAERDTPFGFRALSITPREALLEYLWLFFRMRTVARSLQRAKVVDVATEAIPGFRDVMVAGKLYELTQWRAGSGSSHGRSPYDLVVVDAPPTGQLLPFLQSASAYEELIRGGRASRQLASIDRLIRDDSRIALVAVPEEMSVAETLETVEALREARLPDPVIVVNQLTDPPFPKGTRAAGLRLGGDELSDILRGAGMDADDREAEELVAIVRDVDARVREERRHVQRLARAAPVIELPFLFTPSFGPDEVQDLAGLVAA
jgi:anion-transporting  ArsA/GET3 family ATPase